MINAFEDIREDEDESADVIETKKDKETRIKNLLVQATQTYELLAQCFWKTHLKVEGKFIFPRDHDASDFEDDQL